MNEHTPLRAIDTPLIDPDRLALNPREAMEISHSTLDDRSVMVVDNLYADPAYVRRLALSLHYQFSPGQYPGAMAFVSIYPKAIEDLINAEYVPRAGGRLAIHHHYRSLTFAIVTRPGSELNAVQAQPHFDDFCAHAGLVYLNPDDQASGGTSFWRHRASGLQSASPPDYARVRVAQTQGKLTGTGYLTESNEVWERTDIVEMKFNRLVLYDSLLFHTPHYYEADFGTALNQRRLGQNLYFNPIEAIGD